LTQPAATRRIFGRTMQSFRTTASWRLVLGALALSALGCGANGAPPSGLALWELDLSTPIVETVDSPWGDARVTHWKVLERLRRAVDDADAGGLFLRVGEMQGAWARVEDLAHAAESVRKAKKPVHCYSETTDNLGLAFLARACDRITMTPGGVLNLVGPRAEMLYAHELLHTLGVTPELIEIGRYKGVAETFTRSEMTPETRETLDALLDQFHARLVSDVATGRSLEAERVRALVDQGPFTAHAARQARLVDAVAFDDEAREHARRAAKAPRVQRTPIAEEREPPGLFAILRALRGDTPDAPDRPRIVLAFLDGTILRGDDRHVRSAHAAPFVAAMRRIAADDDVRAVVLRINSPGGSALASDLMWHAVRRVVKQKPVIVSIGDMAASGGYYVASAGTEILARDSSLVGSIGVVGGKVVFEDAASRIGLRVEELKRGHNAGWMSSARRFTDDERAALTRLAETTYQAFVSRVADGRRMNRADVLRWAEGRLMTGAGARAARLVDREGGLDDAIAIARERAKLDPDVEVEVWPRERTLVEALTELTGVGARVPLAAASAWPALGLPRAGVVEWLLADETRIATVLPWTLRIQ
jgi:protease-4